MNEIDKTYEEAVRNFQKEIIDCFRLNVHNSTPRRAARKKVEELFKKHTKGMKYYYLFITLKILNKPPENGGPMQLYFLLQENANQLISELEAIASIEF